MGQFYKQAYQPFFEQVQDTSDAQSKQVGSKGWQFSTVEQSLAAFCQAEFGNMTQKMGNKEKTEFIELLKVLVMAHRVNRDDEFLQQTIVPFATVRDTMYKYSQKAKNTFFAQAAYSFLFLWFAKSAKGKNFANEKFAENTDPRHSERMVREVENLATEARNSLQASKSKLAIKLATFLQDQSI